MTTKQTLNSIISSLSKNLDAFFVGIYIDEEPISTFCINKSKEETLKELVSLIVRKVSKSTEDLIEGFNAEFMFAEGKDYGIFLYKVAENLFIATLIDTKPNFSLLKFEHEKVAKDLSGKVEEIKSFLEEEKGKESAEEKPIKEVKENKAEEIEIKEVSDEVEELEKVFSQEESKVEESKEKGKVEENIEETSPVETEEVSEEIPSLEEILIGEEEELPKDVLKQIEKEFIKEIGPVGKVLFKKAVKSTGVSDKITKTNLKKLIDKLAEEISIPERKVKFLNDTKEIVEGGE